MHTLMIANSIAFGFLFAIWKKKDWVNLIFKMTWLVFLIVNLYNLKG